MEMLLSLFKHLDWANHSILKAILEKRESKEAERLFAHLLTAEQVWMARLEGRDSTRYSLWEEADVQKCREMVQANEGMFSAFLTELNEETLNETVTYQNTKGRTFQNTKRDILLHVALHGQYHRGQINMKLREDGAEPINVDYITYKR